MNIFAVDPMAKVTKGVPESRNITPLKDVTAQVFIWQAEKILIC